MNVFEPLFLLLALVTLVTLLAAAVFAVTGRLSRAGRVLRRLAIGAALYFALVIAVTIVMPRRVYRLGEPQCFDDWCITVAGAHRVDDADGTWEVSLRLSNRARGRPMGEAGTVVYLTDAQGRRHDPLPDPEAVPFDVRLDPGEERTTTRHFHVPPDATDLGLVYTHEGGFPIGWFILTEGGWFARPPIVRLE